MPLNDSAQELKTHLDPLPVFLSVMSESRNSDAVVEMINAAGLSVNLALTASENHSHKTRLRAYGPRLRQAVDALSESDRLRVVKLWSTMVGEKFGEEAYLALTNGLETIGWNLDDGTLSPSSQEVRELFFGHGETHTAWAEIRALVQRCSTNLAIVDRFTDQSVLDLLSVVPATSAVTANVITDIGMLRGRLPDLDQQRATFAHQYGHVSVQIYDDGGVYHDRFLVVDDEYYHLGASIKDAGRKIFMISRLETPDVINALEAAINRIVGATP